MPLRRECQAAGEVGGSWMELRASCDLSQATSARVGEIGSGGLGVSAAVPVGQERETEGDEGEKEGRCRKRKKAVAPRRRRSEAGTAMPLVGEIAIVSRTFPLNDEGQTRKNETGDAKTGLGL